MIQAIDHIGIAVHSLDQAVPRYEKALGVPCERIETVAAQGVRTAFFRVGESRIELLEPTSPESPIARFLAKRGEGLHHLALRSTALDEDLGRAIAAGCRHLDSIPRTGAHGSDVAFLHPQGLAGVLLELCQPAATAAAPSSPSSSHV